MSKYKILKAGAEYYGGTNIIAGKIVEGTPWKYSANIIEVSCAELVRVGANPRLLPVSGLCFALNKKQIKLQKEVKNG